jgi:predicted nucleic acid-binding protein
MPSVVYDARLFIELYYLASEELQRRTKLELTSNEVHLSNSSTWHIGTYADKEGRETAKLRISLIMKDFVVDVSAAIAVRAAEIRHSQSMPMADSLIAATCLVLNCICVSDDPHFKGVKGLPTRWINAASETP